MSEKKQSQEMSPANRLNLDYREEALRLKHFPAPIIDAHTHLNGTEAVTIFKEAAELYGIGRVYSMTRFEEMDRVQDIMGDMVRFIAMPDYRRSRDLYHAITTGYIQQIEKLHAKGVKIVKFWASPRRIDLSDSVGLPDLLNLGAPHHLEVMKAAFEMNMMFMVHVADPDTWFATKYADSKRYGSKVQQYEPLEELLERFPTPWIAAHMGGWPEDLDFLSGLLERHSNLYLDTSAAKWILCELSKHPRQSLLHFFERFRGRILFGSDIVTTDEHLNSSARGGSSGSKASNPEEAFDLYASRFWALRTLFEGTYEGESPIADPDLAMVDPAKYNELDAPQLSGKNFPDELLHSIMFEAAHTLLEENG